MYKSIMQDDLSVCYVCGSGSNLEWHHVFNKSDKKRSEKYGLMVRCCHWCHNEPPNGFHHNKANYDALKRIAQTKFEKLHTHEEFLDVFGRNYL